VTEAIVTGGAAALKKMGALGAGAAELAEMAAGQRLPGELLQRNVCVALRNLAGDSENRAKLGKMRCVEALWAVVATEVVVFEGMRLDPPITHSPLCWRYPRCAHSTPVVLSVRPLCSG
jgi:hypothetical protein